MQRSLAVPAMLAAIATSLAIAGFASPARAGDSTLHESFRASVRALDEKCLAAPFAAAVDSLIHEYRSVSPAALRHLHGRGLEHSTIAVLAYLVETRGQSPDSSTILALGDSVDGPINDPWRDQIEAKLYPGVTRWLDLLSAHAARRTEAALRQSAQLKIRGFDPAVGLAGKALKIQGRAFGEEAGFVSFIPQRRSWTAKREFRDTNRGSKQSSGSGKANEKDSLSARVNGKPETNDATETPTSPAPGDAANASLLSDSTTELPAQVYYAHEEFPEQSALIRSWSGEEIEIIVPQLIEELYWIRVTTAQGVSTGRTPFAVKRLDSDRPYVFSYVAGKEHVFLSGQNGEDDKDLLDHAGVELSALLRYKWCLFRPLTGAGLLAVSETQQDSATPQVNARIAKSKFEFLTGAIVVPDGWKYTTQDALYSVEFGLLAMAGGKRLDGRMRPQTLFGLRIAQNGSAFNGTTLDIGGGWSADFRAPRWKFDGMINVEAPIEGFIRVRCETTFREQNPDFVSLAFGIRGTSQKVVDFLK